MLISEILSQARDLAVDTDATNPYHTDAKLYAIVSNWLHDLGLHVGYPRKQQNISFAVDDGGAANTKNLDNDLGAILLAVWRETTSGAESLLNPRTEAEMAAQNPNWRDEASGKPSYYLVQDAVTAQAQAIGPLRTITTDRKVDAAGTLRLYALQVPAIVSAGTNSPIFAAPFHMSAVHYVAAYMWAPRDLSKFDAHLRIYERLRRILKTLWKEQKDDAGGIWDQYQEGGETSDKLSRF